MLIVISILQLLDLSRMGGIVDPVFQTRLLDVKKAIVATRQLEYTPTVVFHK